MSEPKKWSKEWWTEERMEQLHYYEDPSACTDPDVRALVLKGNEIIFDESIKTSKERVAAYTKLMCEEHGVPTALEYSKIKAERMLTSLGVR